MADEVEDINEERLDEFGESEWAPPVGYHSNIPFYPTGMLGRFFSRFFATKAQAAAGKEFGAAIQSAEDKPITPHRLAGDTVVQADGIKTDSPVGAFSTNTTNIAIPQLEVNRRNRYKDYDLMDTYPEVGTAFDVYSDDATQKTIDGARWTVEHEDEMVVNEVNKLYETLKLARVYWDVVRNTVKFGDCFLELVLDVNDPREGIQRLKILNPNFILRVENEYGYLTDFLQEIPDKSDWSSFGAQAAMMKGSQYITLDKNQIVHFRLFSSDPNYYPYGKSIAAMAIRIFRSLRMMEEAMIIYRLSRAPERRIFYVDVGNLPTSKAEMFVERLKQKFKKEKYYNTATGGMDERYNPLAMDEDFFVPTRGGIGTKIETLPGAQNLGDVDDVKYFRDKLLAILKIPKDYIVEKDKSPERKANLSQLDVKFARTIVRVQHMIEVGLEKIAKRHLYLKGYPKSIVDKLKITLPDPSDMFARRKLELNLQKAEVVQAVIGLGLFPKSYIYKEFYNLSDEKIEEYESQMEDENTQNMEQEAMGAGMTAGAQVGAEAQAQQMYGPPEEEVEAQETENQGSVQKEEKSPLDTVERVTKSLIVDSLDKDKLRILRKLSSNEE